MATKSERFSSDFVMGGTAAIISKSAAAPLDRVKLLLQNQGELLKRGQLKRPYTGVTDCFKRVFKEEGFFSFWRGYFKGLFGRSKERDGYTKWFIGNIASGSAAGATSSLFLYHMDYARTRLAMDSAGISANKKRQFNGLFDVYRKTLETDGVRGLYRGFTVSIVGITMYRGMYFGLYDSLKPIVLIGPFKDNFIASFFLGWSVTTFSGFCAYPFDTLRRRMMMTSGEPIKYRNGIHALCDIIRVEGFWALYRGVTANMLVGVAGAGVLAGYDKLCRITYKS